MFDKIKPIHSSDTQIAEIFKAMIHAHMESLVLESLKYNKVTGDDFAPSPPLNFR